MKKILKPLHDQVQAILRKCLILLMLLTVGLSARAQTFEVGNVRYDVTSETDHTVRVFGYIGEPTDVVIPETVENNGVKYAVTSITMYAFTFCSSLTSVTIPNSVTSIGDGAFQNCTSLASVTIPNSVTSIGKKVFYNTSLTSVTIPNSVTSIGVGPFVFCISLEEILVDAGNANYCSDNGILYNKDKTELIQCPGAKKEVIIPSSVTSIMDLAVGGCTSLSSVTIPNSVTSIGEFAFSLCTSLVSVTIPNSVTSIGTYAFERCESLPSVTISNSVTNIGEGAFSNCASLEEILVDADNANYSSDNGILYNKDKTELIQCPGAKKEVTIPNSVTNIGGSAFYGCTSLASVFIPNSVTSIGTYAFNGCTSLASVAIPNSVTSIRYGAFQNCTSLASVTIPNSVTSIEWKVFWKCTSLKTIYSEPTTPPQVRAGAFDEVPEDAAVYVPEGTIGAYSVANEWNRFTDFREMTATGVSELAVDQKAGPVDVYNMQGMLVKSKASQADIDALAPGLYIIGGRKVLVK